MSVKLFLIRGFFVLLTALVMGVATVGAAQDRIIVDTDFVKQAMQRGALIWDVRAERAYTGGHIPGAINIGSITSVLRDSRTEDYIAIKEIERILGEAGISRSSEIVLYGDKARPDAYFGYVTMRYLGVDKVYVYHGGLDDWETDGNSVDKAPTKLAATQFEAAPNPALLVDTREVINKVGKTSVQIIDARTASEYMGDDIRALRGGHIPGAVNIPYDANWVDPDTPAKLARRKVSNKDGMNLKSRDALQAMYAGLDPDKETIVYCQSGTRASETAVVLQDLGFSNVRVYDSSWLDYGNTFEAPVENVSYFDVSRVNKLIQSLQMQIDTLSDEITTLKAQVKTQ